MKITGNNIHQYIDAYKAVNNKTASRNSAQIKQIDMPKNDEDNKNNRDNNDNKEDIVVISTDINKKKKEKKDYFAELEERYNKFQMVLEQLENSNEQAKAAADAIKVRTNCLMIAMRIMCGDEVPQEDHKYLIKNDPQLYMQAILMKTTKENPKKHKRLSEDEETTQTNSTESGNSSDSPVSEIMSDSEIQTEQIERTEASSIE